MTANDPTPQKSEVNSARVEEGAIRGRCTMPSMAPQLMRAYVEFCDDPVQQLRFLCELGLAGDDLTTFLEFDEGTQLLVLRLLAEPNQDDLLELAKHADAYSLMGWLLTLPVYTDGAS